MRSYIDQYKDNINSLYKRSTLLAEKKMLLLKSCAAKVKRVSNLLKSSSNMLSLMNEVNKKNVEIVNAYHSNNRYFTFTHPDNDFLLVFEQINKDYQTLLRKTNRMLCLYPE